MTVFSRLSDIINSNINALLDKAEDRGKLIRMVIQEMEDTLVEVRSSAVRVIAERKTLERRIAQLEAEQAEWARKAEFALTKDREDLARSALLAKAQTTKNLQDTQAHLNLLGAGLEAQNADMAKLQAKLAEAKAREKELLARQNTASAQMKMRDKIYSARTAGAFEKFDHLARSLDEMEGSVEAYEIGRAKTLADEFAALEAEHAMNDELAQLKNKLNANKDKKET